MIYTKENIKYALLTWDSSTNQHIVSHNVHRPIITGLYLWKNVFAGAFDFPQTQEAFEEYNLVHLNITPGNLPLIYKVLSIINRNKTKILCNIDHAIDMWRSSFPDIEYFFKTIDYADYIFAVEPKMARILSANLKRHVPCIPHPCDCLEINKFCVRKSRNPRILVSTHVYDQSYVLPAMAIRPVLDPSRFYTTVCGSAAYKNRCLSLYNEKLPHMVFNDFINSIADSYAAIESYTINSFGRFTIECACLGIPVIGANCVSSQKALFPTLTTKHNDPEAWSILLNDLVNNPDFYAEAARYALSNVYYYSLENSATRMLNFLNGLSDLEYGTKELDLCQTKTTQE